jgi:hypothetical protein
MGPNDGQQLLLIQKPQAQLTIADHKNEAEKSLFPARPEYVSRTEVYLNAGWS